MLEPDPNVRPSAQQCLQAISDIICQEQNNIFFERDKLSRSGISAVPVNPKTSKMATNLSILGASPDLTSAKKQMPETMPSFVTVVQMDILEHQIQKQNIPEQPESFRKMKIAPKFSPQNSPVLSQGRVSSMTNPKIQKPVIKVNSQDIDPVQPQKRANNWFGVMDTPKSNSRAGNPMDTPQFAGVTGLKQISAESGTMPIASVNSFRVRKGAEHNYSAVAAANTSAGVSNATAGYKSMQLRQAAHSESMNSQQQETDVADEDPRPCIQLHSMLGSGGMVPQHLANKHLCINPPKTMLQLTSCSKVKQGSSWGSLSTQTGNPSMLRSKGSLVHPVILLDDAPIED